MNDFNGALNESLDDFMESYKITDTERIYSNGTEFVPIFRVKQWFEYNNQDKEIERLNNIINELEKALLEWHEYWEDNDYYSFQYKNAYDYLQMLKKEDK